MHADASAMMRCARGGFVGGVMFCGIIVLLLMAIPHAAAEPAQLSPIDTNSTSCAVTGCDRGTCNYAEGRCRCQYGFSGARCEQYLLASCSFGRKDEPSWKPPLIAPSIRSMEVMKPVSCMCLKELAEANGPRGKREVFPWQECFVRVPSMPVPAHELLLMQHSAYHPMAALLTTPLALLAPSSAGPPPPSKPVRYERLFTTFQDFDAPQFMRACGVPDAEEASSGSYVSGARIKVTDEGDPCREFARLFYANPRERHGPENTWADDVLCHENSNGVCKRMAGMINPSASAMVRGDPNSKYNSGGGNNGTLGPSAPPPPCCLPGSGRCRDTYPGGSAYYPCSCIIGMMGPVCENPCSLGCVNECSGRGECIAAWCKCQPGWFGIDCSIPGSTTTNNNLYSSSWRAGTPIGPTLPPPKSVDELKIYVYDVAPSVLQAEPCPFGCGAFCGDPLYKANIYFLSSLLKDPVHRTDDPNKAHLFLAPQLPYRYNSNGVEVGPHMLDTVDAILGMGYFSRNAGKDHIWWAVSDIGTCQVPALVHPGIILGHYGRLDVRLQWPYACIDPQKDLVLPPITYVSRPMMQFVDHGGVREAVYIQPGGVDQARAAYEGKGPLLPRPIFLFMAASNREMLNKACADPNNNSKKCRDDEYAMGARAAIFSWFREHAAGVPDIGLYEHSFSAEEYYYKLRSSRFCVEALGHGFSTRLMDYMVSGCIPVIVRDDVLWPYESFSLSGDETQSWLQDDPSPAWGDFPRVQYRDFAVWFRKREVPNMLETLRGISDERVRELQAGCQRVHKAFLWDQNYGMAYNYTIAGLARLRAKMQL
eukprot:jgi/Mesvir1/22933/Mv19447-RA.1